MTTIEERIANLRTYADCHILAMQIDASVRPNRRGDAVQRFLAGWLRVAGMVDAGEVGRTDSHTIMDIVRG